MFTEENDHLIINADDHGVEIGLQIADQNLVDIVEVDREIVNRIDGNEDLVVENVDGMCI